MAKRVLTVACHIPGGFGDYVSFKSKASLLDADYVLFAPDLEEFITFDTSTYKGKPALTDDSSFQLQETLSHWRREIRDVMAAGKTVFVTLIAHQEVFVATGENTYSGTGRNRQITRMVSPVSNYDVLPVITDITESIGTSIILHPKSSLLKDYWQMFGDENEYRVYLKNSQLFEPLLTTRDGSRVVGGIFNDGSEGALVALPWVCLEKEEYITDEYEDDEGEIKYLWTPVAKSWGNRFLNALSSIDQALKSQSDRTPTPQWVQSDTYKTEEEITLSEELLDIRSQIADLERKNEDKVAKLADAGSLKALLFEQGVPLEEAVLKAMRLMGFSANRYRDSESEFDGVFECSEGRCVGEVEGKDNKAVNIDKMRQLETNVLEDLSRDEVSEPAKAVLFGNAYRLTPSLGKA